MTDHASAGHGPTSDGPGARAAGNPEVHFERSDIGASGVATFVVALAVLLVVCGVLVAGLFRVYQNRARAADALNSLPLAGTDSGRMPASPRLEGINPNADVDRAWTRGPQSGHAAPWFGYNVRVVPPAQLDPGADAEKRDRLATEAMGQKLQKIDATMADLAGKLPARSVALPPDRLRRPPGEGNSGRPVGEKSP